MSQLNKIDSPAYPFPYVSRHKKPRNATLSSSIPQNILSKQQNETQKQIVSHSSARNVVLNSITQITEGASSETHEVTNEFKNKFYETPPITDSTGLILPGEELGPYELTLSSKSYQNLKNLNTNLKNPFTKGIDHFPVNHLRIFVLKEPKEPQIREYSMPDFLNDKVKNYFKFDELRESGLFTEIEILKTKIDKEVDELHISPEKNRKDIYLEFLNLCCSDFNFYSEMQIIGTSLFLLGIKHSEIGNILEKYVREPKISLTEHSNIASMVFHSLRGDRYDENGKNQNFSSLSQADTILLSCIIDDLLLQNKYIIKSKIIECAENLLRARKAYVQRIFTILDLNLNATRYVAAKNYLEEHQNVETSVIEIFKKKQMDAKKAQNIERIRYYNCTKTAIIRWFCQFFVYIYKVIGPNYNCFWNIDEMSIAFDSRSTWVYTRSNGQLVVPLSDDVSHITILCGFSAAGNLLPPMLILNNVKKISKELANIVGNRAILTSSQNGWITKPLFKEYISQVLEYLPTLCIDTKRHCIASDGHASRLNYPAALNCAIHQTDLLTLGSHATHCKQPFDVVGARPFKQGYKDLYFKQRSLYGEIDAETQRCLIIRCILESYYTKLTPDICRKSFEVAGLAPLSLNRMIKPDLINMNDDEDKERTLRLKSRRALASSSLLTSSSMLKQLKEQNIQSNENRKKKIAAQPNDVKQKESIVFRWENSSFVPHTLSNDILEDIEELEKQYNALPDDKKFVLEEAEGIYQQQPHDDHSQAENIKPVHTRSKGNKKLAKRYEKIQYANFDPVETRRKPN